MADRNFIFVSDLHLSEGFLPDKKYYHKNEDFFYDDAFGRFLAYLQGRRKNADNDNYKYPWRLVIVGDFLDNLQITTLPSAPDKEDKKEGAREEDDTDGVKAALVAFLKNVQSVIYPDEGSRPDFDGIRFDPNEKNYGLAFDAPKSVWKLARIMDGHPGFFAALAEFLAAGNELVIVKGNHDPEFTYAEFRRYFVDRLNRLARDKYDVDVAGRIFFSPWFYYEPGLFYAEHGGQYDDANRYTFFLEPTMVDERTGAVTIRLPLFGSFFVRYVFNKIEDRIPFADNVRPLKKAVGWIFKNELGFTICTIPQGFRFLYNYSLRKLTSGFDILAAAEANKNQGGILQRLLWLVRQPFKILITARERLEYTSTRATNSLIIGNLAGTNGLLREAGGERVDPDIRDDTLHRIYYRAFKDDKKTEERAAEASALLPRLKGAAETAPEELGKDDNEVIERAIGRIRSGKETKPFFQYTLPKWSGVIVRVLCSLVFFDWLGWLYFTRELPGRSVADAVVLTVLAFLASSCFWLYPRVQKELVRRHLDTEPERYLNQAAAGVARLLGPERARFVIFGHTHVAYARPIKEDKEDEEETERRPEQWEVNTGSWTPVFDERMILRRNGDEFPFIQIVTERAGLQPDFGLYQWNDGVGLPQPIRFTGED